MFFQNKFFLQAVVCCVTYVIHSWDGESGGQVGAVELSLVLMLEQHRVVQNTLPLPAEDDDTLLNGISFENQIPE